MSERNLASKVEPFISASTLRQDVSSCLDGNMTLEVTAELYFYPFEMEFCLTAMGLLFIIMAIGGMKREEVGKLEVDAVYLN